MEPDYRALFDQIPSDSVVFDEKLGIVAATAGWRERTGQTGADIVGRRLADLLPDGQSVDADGRAALEDAVRRAFRTGERETSVARCAVRMDAGLEVRQWEALTFPIDGGARVMQTILPDTRVHLLALEQTQATAARAMAGAETERRRLRAVLAALPVGVGIIDSTGEIVEANALASELLRHPAALAALRRASSGPVSESFDSCRLSAAPVIGAGGRVIGAVGVFVDVTESPVSR